MTVEGPAGVITPAGHDHTGDKTLCQIYRTKRGNYVRLCQRYLDAHGWPAEAVFRPDGMVKNRVPFCGDAPVDYSGRGTVNEGFTHYHYDPSRRAAKE